MMKRFELEEYASGLDPSINNTKKVYEEAMEIEE
jgi:hypothetical protein